MMTTPSEALDRPLLIRVGKLIDGVSTAPLPDASLLMTSGRIEYVGPSTGVSAPSDATVLDFPKAMALPGLIDAHVHLADEMTRPEYDWNYSLMRLTSSPAFEALKAARAARRTLEAGFTTVRNIGGPGGWDYALRDAIELGIVPGCRVFTSGPWLWSIRQGPIWEPPNEGVVDGSDAIRTAVRNRLRHGAADFIKVFSTGSVVDEGSAPQGTHYTVEELRAAAEEAHAVGKTVACHAHGTAGIKNALLAGIDTIEHGTYLDEETIGLMLSGDRYLVPTLSVHYGFMKHKDMLASNVTSKSEGMRQSRLENVRRAYEAGVKICCGTDTARLLEHGANALELELLVQELGMSPMEALQSATRVNAEAMGLAERLGTLEKGKVADLLIVKGDPMKDIRVLSDRQAIVLVVKDGRVVVDRR